MGTALAFPIPVGWYAPSVPARAPSRPNEKSRSGAGPSDAALVVGDDGPGIGNAASDELGRRGQRLDQAKPGSGLGLAIAREIIALNDGSIALGKASEGGLQVTVRLPLAARPAG